MVLWLKKADGSCVRLVDKWNPRIYVGGDFGDLLDLACQPFMPKCSFVNKCERAGYTNRTKVLEVQVRNETDADNLARKIVRHGGYSRFRLYNVDVPFTQMYLYQKDLFPLAFVEAEEDDEIQWTMKDSRDAIDYELPPLRNVRLQVETVKTSRVQRTEDDLARIIIRNDNERILIDTGDEANKILRLVETFQDLDPDIIVTDGGDAFIFPYLTGRANQHGVLDKLILGRERTPLRVHEVQGHSYFSYGKILYRQTAARLLGRLHIDEANAFFVNDCGLEGLFEVARTCVIPIQRTSRTTIGTSMTSLQFYHAVKQGILIPWNKNDPEEFKDGNELVIADRGGFIFEPKVGIHDNVGELDFASMYPTIMRDHNLSGETVKCKCCPNSKDRVPELGYNICERWKGIVPRSLDILLQKTSPIQEEQEGSPRLLNRAQV